MHMYESAAAVVLAEVQRQTVVLLYVSNIYFYFYYQLHVILWLSAWFGIVFVYIRTS